MYGSDKSALKAGKKKKSKWHSCTKNYTPFHTSGATLWRLGILFFVVAAFALRNRSVFSDQIFVKMFFHISSVLNEKKKKEFTFRNKQTMY